MLSGINWLAVVVAAVTGFVVGAIWFGPLFGKAWMQAMDRKPEELGHPAKAMGLTAVTTLITAIALAWFLDALGVATWLGGMSWGIAIGVFFVGTSNWSDGLFMGTPNALLLINIAHRVVYLAVMGAILGAWPA